MKRFFKWLVSPVVLGFFALLAISAIIWWVGPLIAIGESRPLESTWTRVIVIAVLWLAWIARRVWVAWRYRQAQAALMKGISGGPTASDREAEVLGKAFRDAMEKLKGSGANRGWFGRGNSLYDLPWYVFVGAPGSGKTTALQNSGLQFLLTEGSSASPVKGVGGTRNCDWWFTSEAVLIDTAGRYATQESDSEVDSSAWNNFLALLRKSRPRRPINGVLLTVNVQDLLQQGAVERKQHADKLRARLHELQTKLGVRAPVYVLVTKADLIAGFNETFDALGKEERDQVWGFTFDAKTAHADQPLASFETDYAALEQRLNSSLFDRLQAERDASKRSGIFGFPQEFSSFRPVLGDFLKQVFASGGSLQDELRLRGVYFTSGTQEGTPIDRVMGALARSFGLERRVSAAPGQRGKSFFLRRLLQNLVFPEQSLVAFNPVAERRRLGLRIAGFSAVALLSVALLAGWGISFVRNKSYGDEVAARLPALQQAVDGLPTAISGDVSAMPPVLTAVRHAADPTGFALADPPLLNTLGLYQADKLDAAAQISYRRLLEHALLPRVTRRLEERLRAANRDNLEQAYEALKAYLMIYTPDKFDAEPLKAWISVDLDAQFANQPAELRQSLDQHVSALLALGAPSSATPMDTGLVGTARDMLASFPLEYRIYSRLKRQFRSGGADFSVASSGGPQASKVFVRQSGEPLSRGVPAFYTRDGYVEAFEGGAARKAAAQLGGEEQWVFGRSAGAKSAVGDLLGNELTDKVRRLYLQDYILVWEKFLADVKLVKLDSIDRSLEVSQILASVDSPLASFLRGVARETTLVPPPKAPSVLDKAAAQANKAKQEMTALVDPAAAPTATKGGPIEKMVDDRFASVRRMITGEPPPINGVLKTFGDVAAQMQAIKLKTPPPPGGAGPAQMKADAAQMPEPAKAALEKLSDAVAQQGRVVEREGMTGELKPVFEFCTRAIGNRYPFATGSRADVLPEDFGELFGVGGKLDDFYQRRLAALVDTSTNPWGYKPLADGSKPATPASLADFQRSQRIKDAFFRSGGKAPGFKLDIRVVEMTDPLKELTIDIDGQPAKFVAGNTAPVTITWPAKSVASQIKLTSLPATTPLTFEGPWALFRLFERFEVQPTAQPEKFNVVMNLEGKKARLEITANSVLNPFRMREMTQFRCPGAL